MTDIWRWGSPRFSDQPLVGNRADEWGRLVRRPGVVFALGAATFGVVATAFLAIGYVRFERLTTAQVLAVRHAERANADLQDALARLRDRLGVANQTLRTTQGRVAALSDETHRQLQVSEQSTTSKADRIAQLTHALDQMQREVHLAEAERVTLMARLSRSEAEAAAGRSHQQQAQAGLDQWQKKVQQLTADRDKAAGERDQLRARLSQLEQKLSMRMRQPSERMAAAQPAAPVPPVAAVPAAPARAAAVAARPTAAPTATATATATATPTATATAAAGRAVAAAAAPVAVSRSGLSQLERVLASTGVDVARLFKDFGAESGLGGPFVPAPRGGLPESHFSAAKLAALPGLLKSLPLSVPMRNYRETSAFGDRTDPFNGRPAFHPGIDLAAPYGTPVYATAAGVVTFSGWSGGYGKIVEINHGHGIVTRYGHLARSIVLVGERVRDGTQIGFEGSTGRSTGPHVIYEIDVNGEPRDPAKFLGLARLVHVAQYVARR